MNEPTAPARPYFGDAWSADYAAGYAAGVESVTREGVHTMIECPACSTLTKVPIEVTVEDDNSLTCTPDLVYLWAHAWSCGKDSS